MIPALRVQRVKLITCGTRCVREAYIKQRGSSLRPQTVSREFLGSGYLKIIISISPPRRIRRSPRTRCIPPKRKAFTPIPAVEATQHMAGSLLAMLQTTATRTRQTEDSLRKHLYFYKRGK